MGRRSTWGMGPGPWGPGGPGFGPPWGRGPRARRGDVRFALLAALEDQPRHGYELIGHLEERSGGRWRPSAGSVYPTLQLLEDEGLITGEERDGKRVYSLTAAGRDALAERRAGGHWTPPWEGGPDDEGLRRLHEAAGSLMAAAMQAAHTGNERHREAALAALNEARRSIYASLAED